MAGPRFDWGRFMETGGKFAYEILSEEKKYKKKMDEIEAKIKGEREEEERKRQANLQEGIFTGFVSLLGDPDVDAFTKRAIYQGHLLPVLTGMGQATPTQAGTTMPGGAAGVEGLPPLRPEDVAGAGALFEAPAEEPEKYPQTRGEVREHEEFKAGLKGPSVAERKLKINAQQVAAALERGLKVTKEALTGRITSVPIGGTLKGVTKKATKEDAIRASIEMGWAPGTPEYQQYIAPAIDKWWETKGKFDALKNDPTIRKQVRQILKSNKVRPTEEKIDKFIVNNYDKLME